MCWTTFPIGLNIVVTALRTGTCGLQVKRLQAIRKTAIQNVAALRIMCAAMAGDAATGLRLVWDFRHHPHFPTLSIKR